VSRAVADIQADLTAAYAARRKAMDAKSYGVNTGQGQITVTRDLKELNATIRELESELGEANGTGPQTIAVHAGRGGI
jgi:hypothetical protein